MGDKKQVWQKSSECSYPIRERKKSHDMDSLRLWCQKEEDGVSSSSLYLIVPFFSAFLPLILVTLLMPKFARNFQYLTAERPLLLFVSHFWICTRNQFLGCKPSQTIKNYNDDNNNKNSWKLLNYSFSLPTCIVAICQVILCPFVPSISNCFPVSIFHQVTPYLNKFHQVTKVSLLFFLMGNSIF